MSRRLLELARQGDVTAFEDLIKQHERFVFGIAWRVLGNMQDAQDATQEVFLRLHRYLNSLDEERKINPWLYQLTINICRDIRRRARRRCVVSLEELWSETGFEGARQVRKAQRPQREKTVPAEPFVVKLLTDDPDVTIYWILDAKGDTE